VLRLDFEIEDLAAVRFAISPVTETVGALRVLGDPEEPGPHGSWLQVLGTWGTTGRSASRSICCPLTVTSPIS
jgi:hypothetical protein